MDTEKLYEFLIKHVSSFLNPMLIEQGECYHYTAHWDKIEKQNKFKGAKIDKNLDRTQSIAYLGEATEENGVVFAYENLADAIEEGFDLDIVKIRYKRAIKALHRGENDLGEMMSQLALESGILMDENLTPPTILILASDIIDFELWKE